MHILSKEQLLESLSNYKQHANDEQYISTELLVMRHIISDELHEIVFADSKVFKTFKDDLFCACFLLDLSAQIHFEFMNTVMSVKTLDQFGKMVSSKKNNYRRALNVLFPNIAMDEIMDIHEFFNTQIEEYVVAYLDR